MPCGSILYDFVGYIRELSASLADSPTTDNKKN